MLLAAIVISLLVALKTFGCVQSGSGDLSSLYISVN